MKKININLENCYGIGGLEHEFDFSKSNSFLIYAPNGTMKTSLAKTLHYFSEENVDAPCDRVYPDRNSVFELKIDGVDVESKDRVLVISPDNDAYDSSNKISNFLASKELKEKYDNIYQEIESRQKAFITKLKKVSGSTDCHNELIETFKQKDDDTFLNIINSVRTQIDDKSKLYEFRYNDVFDKKGNVKKFLEKHQENLDQYIEIYQSLLSKSSFFNSELGNSFGTYQAGQIVKSISDNSFFNAGHVLELSGSNKVESVEGLKDIVESEIDKIIGDEDLKKIFDTVTKAIDSNSELRDFKNVLEKDPLLLVELKDYELLRKKVWLGFLSKLADELFELDNFYISQKAKLEELLKKAKEELEIWRSLIGRFNDRFHVPFKVILKNQEDVLLKEEKAVLDFEFYDGRSEPPVNHDKESLLQILSKGERKAHFILQLLFDIESRSQNDEKTLLVFDDIADSFDYKNKYAIVEYIKDLHTAPDNFGLIILTHNFDFYRTIASRLYLDRKTAILMAIKNSNGGVTLNRGEYVKGAFKHFLENVKNKKTFVSLVPFIRNLIEYTEDESCDDYNLLTQCLHKKDGSDDIQCSEIVAVWKNRFNTNYFDGVTFGEDKIIEVIIDTADEIITEGDKVDEIYLQNKIVLSIAIRIKAEMFMINRLPGINLDSLQTPQTPHLFNQFKQTTCTEEEISTLDKVILMTPENIHVNAFMYEPLVDMSVHHLMSLYSAVCNLR